MIHHFLLGTAPTQSIVQALLECVSRAPVRAERCLTVSTSCRSCPRTTVHVVLCVSTTTVNRNDPRLMQEAPEILAISSILERPVGRYMSYSLLCIGPVVATILASAKRSQPAVVVASGAFMILIVLCNLIILKCGTLLVHTINGSLRKNSGNTRTIASSASEPSATRPVDENTKNSTTAGRKERNPNKLLAARKKITVAMSICIISAVQTILLLTFAIFSGYGMAAPLLFFGICM